MKDPAIPMWQDAEQEAQAEYSSACSSVDDVLALWINDFCKFMFRVFVPLLALTAVAGQIAMWLGWKP